MAHDRHEKGHGEKGWHRHRDKIRVPSAFLVGKWNFGRPKTIENTVVKRQFRFRNRQLARDPYFRFPRWARFAFWAEDNFQWLFVGFLSLLILLPVVDALTDSNKNALIVVLAVIIVIFLLGVIGLPLIGLAAYHRYLRTRTRKVLKRDDAGEKKSKNKGETRNKNARKK